MKEPAISAKRVSEENRDNFLPKHFGKPLMLIGERATYSWMSRLCSDYHGGFWNFYELSNGGFYLAPESDALFHIQVDTNGADVKVNADAAGIIATLFALNYLFDMYSEKTNVEPLIDAYYALRDFAAQHPHANEIYAAID